MNKHIIVIPATHAQGRWREAFEGVAVVSGTAAALRLVAPETFFWVDARHPQWMAALRAAHPELPLIAISLNPSAEEGMLSFEAGARGYCHALAVPAMLQQVVLVISNGGLWLGAELMARAAAAIVRAAALQPSEKKANPAFDELTPRERDVALKVADGASNKEVARLLDITPRTVKAHMGAIFHKLGVRDRLHLVLRLRGTSGGSA